MSEVSTEVPAAESATGFQQMKVLLEGNEEGAWILPELSYWLEPTSSELALIQVMEAPSRPDDDPKVFWEKVSHERNRLNALRKDYVSSLEQQHFRVSEDYVSDASDTACKQILGTPQDLVVVGTAKDQHKHEPASSFTMRMANHALSSVLILKRLVSPDSKKLNVVLATDGSDASLEAARKLPKLLKTDAMAVTLINVKEVPILQNPVLAPYVNVEAVDQALEQNAQMAMDMTRKLLDQGGIEVVDTRIVEGTPTYDLMQALESMAPDLVVAGCHNRSGLTKWLLGSVSHRLVQSDTHNLLIVR